MRLKPHTYRRLAWVACWTVLQKAHEMFLDSRPAQHEMECFSKLLSLYKAFLEQFKSIDYVDRALNPELEIHHGDPDVWKRIRNCQVPSIQDLLVLFPTPNSLILFLRQFEPVFCISGITRYCADGTTRSYKGYLLVGMLSCFGGQARSFSADFLNTLSEFYFSWCVRGHNFQTSDDCAMEYCELYRGLYSNVFPISPNEEENERRCHISNKKRSKNQERESVKQKHIAMILNGLEKEKTAYLMLSQAQREHQKRPTRQRFCERYFQQHSKDMKALQITSSRTLENLCSRKFGRSANAVRQEKNSIQPSQPIYEEKLYRELQINRDDTVLIPLPAKKNL